MRGRASLGRCLRWKSQWISGASRRLASPSHQFRSFAIHMAIKRKDYTHQMPVSFTIQTSRTAVFTLHCHTYSRKELEHPPNCPDLDILFTNNCAATTNVKER